MPLRYARFLVGRDRTVAANRQVGWLLAFVAGAINAGGFLAVRQYTSHVTGLVSSVADHLVLGEGQLVAAALAAVLAFLLGAMCCAVMVNFARRRALASEYALPLLPPTGTGPAPPGSAPAAPGAPPSGGASGPGTIDTRPFTSLVQMRSDADSTPTQTSPGWQSSSRKHSSPKPPGSCGPPQLAAMANAIRTARL